MSSPSSQFFRYQSSGWLSGLSAVTKLVLAELEAKLLSSDSQPKSFHLYDVQGP